VNVPYAVIYDVPPAAKITAVRIYLPMELLGEQQASALR
jgi:hypothetical protein